MSRRTGNVEDMDDDLFNTLKGNKSDKKRNDNSDSENSYTEEKRSVLKNGPDYYKILGVPQLSEFKESQDKEENAKLYQRFLKHRATKMLTKYHPDKLPKGLTSEEKKKNESMYKWVREASDVLLDKNKREYYDLQRKVTLGKDFDYQKSTFDEFIKLQESEMTEEKKHSASLEFERETSKKNKQIGYDPEQAKVKLDSKTAKQLMQDRLAQRELEEIEIHKPNIFEGRKFSNEEFQKQFEKEKRKRDKLGKLKKTGDLVLYDDLSAFNDSGMGGASFVSTDNYDSMFANEPVVSGNNFAGIDENYSEGSNSDISVSSGEIDTSYVTGHNKDKGNTNKRFEEFMNARKRDNELFDNMKQSEFKDVTHDKFGISKNFGSLVGNNFTESNIASSKKKKEISGDMVNAYKHLISHDKKDKGGK